MGTRDRLVDTRVAGASNTVAHRMGALERRTRRQSDELAHYRGLVDASTDAMVVVGESGRIDLVNTQAERLFGYASAELIRQSIELLVPERFQASLAGHVTRLLADGEGHPAGIRVELSGRHKDGTEVPVEVGLVRSTSAGGVTVCAFIRDVSGRKRLESSAKLLTSALEFSQNALALFDDEHRLVLCNGRYRSLLGDSVSGPLLGRTYAELRDAWIGRIAFTSDVERERYRAERIDTRAVLNVTFDVRLLDGRSLRVTDRRTPEGGIVKTIWEMTEDVRLSEELRAARELAEGASRAKSEFLSSMSHELRTPLNAILGFAQILQRDKREPLGGRQTGRVAQILSGGQHLLRLIDDILDLACIEAGQVTLSIEPVGVGEVLETVYTTLEPLAAQSGVEIVVGAPVEGAAQVIVDRTRFLQILINLGSNAIKYNRPQGTVTFSVSEPSPGMVRVGVRDTGMGIAQDQQEKLFQPFQRAGQETGPIEGTGIGLVITRRLARLMGGDVGFRSVLGEGSEFWVDVPTYVSPTTFSQGPPSTTCEVTESVSTDRRHTVLYIEDNPANARFMAALMEDLGTFELLVAPSADVGLAKARECRPDVIIMDINLPRMSGLEAMSVLRATPETAHIPVIALSAAASTDDYERGAAVGFRRYLTKPVKVDELVRTLEQLLA